MSRISSDKEKLANYASDIDTSSEFKCFITMLLVLVTVMLLFYLSLDPQTLFNLYCPFGKLFFVVRNYKYLDWVAPFPHIRSIITL